MKKLFTLLTMLLIGIGSTWAETGTITLTKSYIEFLRNYKSDILDINNTGRNATRFASIISPLIAVNNGGGNIGVSSFTIHSTGTNTIQMLAGYTITSYSITVTPEQNATFTATEGTADVTSLTASTQATINVTGVSANSCSFKFTGNPTAAYNTISQIVVNYSYTTAPTMVQTMADLSYADCASCPTYTITCQRSALYVAQNGTNLTTVHAVSSPTDARKKFAFIKNTSTGKYYLYNVEEGKFVNSNKSLANYPTNAVELHFTNNFTYPQYVRVGSNYMNVQEKGSTAGGVKLGSWVEQDGGNCFIIEPVGTADLTRAHKIVNGWNATFHIDGTTFTATGAVTYNGTLSLPNTLKRAYCTYKYYSDAECENEITTANDVYDDIYVKYDYTGPFAFSTEGVSPEYVYYLLRTYNNNFLYSSGSSIAVTTTSNTGDAYQWAIVGNPYAFTLKNKSTGTYMVASYSPNGEATLGATGTSFGLYTNTQAPVTNHFTAVTTNGNNLVIPQNHPNAGSGIRCYNGTGATFTDVTGLNNLAGAFFIPFAVVTYNLIWNESTIQSTTKGSIIGTASEDEKPWDVPAYSSFVYDVTTIGKTTSAVNVTMSWDGPFELSENFNTATWYYLTNNNIHYLYYSSEAVDEYKVLITDDNLSGAGIYAMWAFVGNPYDGIRVINLGAGNGMYLNLGTKADMVAATYPTYSLCDIIEGSGFFKLKNGTFYLVNNNNSGVVADDREIWYKSTWAQFQVSAVDFKALALDFIDEYASSHALGQYFGVSTESYNYIRNSFAEAESVSAEEYTSLVSYISAWLSPKLPETGYYRIKSSGSRGDQSYITYGYLDGSKGTGLLTTIGNKETDLGTVVKLTRVGTGKNYKISIQGLNVQAHSGDDILFRATGAEGLNFQFNHINFSGMCSIYDGTNHGNMHEADWKKQDTGLNGVVGWDAGDGTNASSWSVEDATTCTVTLNSDGATTPTYYATLCLPFDVTISGATAYKLTQSGNYLVPDEVEDNKVPAGTPVLLKGTSSSATATINTGDAFNSGSPLTCALTGTYLATTVNTTVGSGNYVFGKKDGNVGFYHVANENFSLKANRAYLSLGSDIGGDVNGCRLMFDDNVTGIVSPIGGTEEESTIYNLSGQRLNEMQKGINIVNGKKVLF